ncbi:MAG: ATP-binding cassette domain-containing protein [Candidatus Bathyarchaeia archaeon]
MSVLAVEARGLRYVYPDGTVALDGVSLKVYEGQSVAVLGPNGAGKSTLLLQLAGLLTPTRGTVELLGLSTVGAEKRRARLKVGIVFQNPDDQLFCSSLKEDVAYGPVNLGLSAEDVKQRVAWALQLVGLEKSGGKAPHHLSYGERKKAAIATVLAMKPKLLLLDEPTANLDPGSRRELMRLLKGLRETDGTTLILATHDVEAVAELADYVFVLNGGRLETEGLTRRVLSDRQLLKRVHLEQPQLTQLVALLKEARLLHPGGDDPITMEETYGLLLERLQKTAGPRAF